MRGCGIKISSFGLEQMTNLKAFLGFKVCASFSTLGILHGIPDIPVLSSSG
jgi:hypothetical protein